MSLSHLRSHLYQRRARVYCLSAGRNEAYREEALARVLKQSRFVACF